MVDINERLMSAAKAGSEVELKALLRDPDCDALTQDKVGLTALMVAAESGSGAGVQLLLPVSDALAKDTNGRTALMRAACMGYEGCVKLLLPVSDALGKDNMGMTALMGAVLNGCAGCVEILLPASDTSATDHSGWTATDWARVENHVNLILLIDAYDLAQSERSAIEVAALPGPPRDRTSLRV